MCGGRGVFLFILLMLCSFSAMSDQAVHYLMNDPVPEESENEDDDASDNSIGDDFNYSSDFEEEDFSNNSDSCPTGEEPIYPGSDVTFEMAMIAILTLVLSQKLSKTCVGLLLQLLKLLLPKDNILVQSSHLFYSYFDKYLSNYVRHYYCGDCSESMQAGDAVCPRCGGSTVNFFLQFSISEQLQFLLSQPGFYEKLDYPQNRKKKNENNYEDLYDGKIYKEAQEKYFRFGKWISFLWNTDGFSIFRSSTFSVWPFYLSINELPPYLRLKKENMLLAGLWFGTGKFDPNVFLKPIYDEMCRLRQGITVNIPSLLNPTVILKAALLCGTADSPGKSGFFRHTQFNGLFGCMKCLTRGLKSQASGNVFVYPYEEQLALRSDNTLTTHLTYLRDTGKKVRFGVKGPSFLHKMLLLCSIRSTSIDIMHLLFLGCQKTLLELWFGKAHKNKEFSLFNCTKIVNDYLKSVKPPHFLQRCPQPLSKLAFWKASEYQSFFFFYSLPVLSIIMDPVYFNHYLLLYQGIYLLCQESVSDDDIQMSQQLLDLFVKRFQELYGLRYMSSNLHGLRHLPAVVAELGPLQFSTCFLFEDLNGMLKHLTHGTQHIGLQVQSNFGLVTRLSFLIKSCQDGALKNLCLQMYAPFKRLKVYFSINSFTDVVGVPSRVFTFQPILAQCMRNYLGNISYFKRLKVNSTLFVVLSACEGRKLSSHVLYKFNGDVYQGILHVFFKLSHCECIAVLCQCPTLFYAVLQRLVTMNPFKTLYIESTVKSALMYTVSENVDVIPIHDIIDICTQVSFSGKDYVIVRPNQLSTQ